MILWALLILSLLVVSTAGFECKITEVAAWKTEIRFEDTYTDVEYDACTTKFHTLGAVGMRLQFYCNEVYPADSLTINGVEYNSCTASEDSVNTIVDLNNNEDMILGVTYVPSYDGVGSLHMPSYTITFFGQNEVMKKEIVVVEPDGLLLIDSCDQTRLLLTSADSIIGLNLEEEEEEEDQKEHVLFFDFSYLGNDLGQAIHSREINIVGYYSSDDSTNINCKTDVSELQVLFDTSTELWYQEDDTCLETFLWKAIFARARQILLVFYHKNSVRIPRSWTFDVAILPAKNVLSSTHMRESRNLNLASTTRSEHSRLFIKAYKKDESRGINAFTFSSVKHAGSNQDYSTALVMSQDLGSQFFNILDNTDLQVLRSLGGHFKDVVYGVMTNDKPDSSYKTGSFNIDFVAVQVYIDPWIQIVALILGIPILSVTFGFVLHFAVLQNITGNKKQRPPLTDQCENGIAWSDLFHSDRVEADNRLRPYMIPRPLCICQLANTAIASSSCGERCICASHFVFHATNNKYHFRKYVRHSSRRRKSGGKKK